MMTGLVGMAGGEQRRLVELPADQLHRRRHAVLRETRRYRKAGQAEEIADELGDKMGLAEAVRGLGKAYLATKEYTKARECIARAVRIAWVLRFEGDRVFLSVAFGF